jgi:hypothetical protein
MDTSSPVQIVKDVLRNIPTGNETVFDLAREVGGDGKEPKTVLTVVNRRVNPEPPPQPVKSPSPRRQHEFYDVAGFVAYLAKYGSGTTVVQADPQSETVTAIMDNAAKDGFEIITFRPQIHPIFKPWKDMVELGEDEEPEEKYKPIRQMVDFLSENRRAIMACHVPSRLLTIPSMADYCLVRPTAGRDRCGADVTDGDMRPNYSLTTRWRVYGPTTGMASARPACRRSSMTEMRADPLCIFGRLA